MISSQTGSIECEWSNELLKGNLAFAMRQMHRGNGHTSVEIGFCLYAD